MALWHMATGNRRRVCWESNVRAQPFAAKLAAAAAGGFDTLTVPTRVYKAAIEDGLKDRDLLALASDAGVELDFLDGMSGWTRIRYPPTVDAWVQAALDFSAEYCLQMCNALGLRHVVAIAGFEPDALSLSELVDSFGAFCNLAAKSGIWVDLEPMPMLGIPTLQMAWDIVSRADCPNSGIMFDTWHFMRGSPNMSLLRSIPAERIVNIQVVDAMREPRGASLWEDALRYRMFPGEGELPLVPMLEILQAKGAVRSYGPEIFSDEIDAMAPAVAASKAAQTTDIVMSKAGFPLRPVRQPAIR